MSDPHFEWAELPSAEEMLAVGRCKSCKHWRVEKPAYKPPGEPDFGECRAIFWWRKGADMSKAGGKMVCQHDAPSFGPDFGCVHWVRRQSKS